MKVAVVTLNWNGWDDTERCLRSLERLDEVPMATIVVDNGSTDGSAERIAAEFPDVDLVRSSRNLGFAGGANLGIRRALERDDVRAVWLLNNDAEVEPGTLRALLATARETGAGIAGGVVVETGTGRVHSWGGGSVSPWTGTATLATGPTRDLGYVTGACMLVVREVFEQVGLFDERYFFYFEDADLCRRARRTGWRLAVAPDARIRHAVGATVNRGGAGRSSIADWFQVESSAIYLARHRGLAAPAVAGVRLAGIVARRARRGELGRVPLLTRALVRGLRRGRAETPTTPVPPSRPSA